MSEEIDWQEQAKKSGGQYFTPDQGTQEINFLDEGVSYKDQKQYDKKEHEYAEFTVEVDGQEMKWEMKMNHGEGAKFGQIKRYALQNDGLEGETVEWLRQGEGTQTKHILLDLNRDDSDSDNEEAIFDGDDEEE